MNWEKGTMKSQFNRLISAIVFVLCMMVSSAWADTALIYHSSYSDAHTNLKAQLEADGYTVTMSTSGSIASNLYTNNIDGTSGGYDVVVDLKYNNNIGSNGRGHYDDFVKAGGVLIVTGENETNFSSRNSNIENLISNKFGGSLTMGNAGGYVDALNSTYTDSSIDSGSNMMYIAGGASLSGDGQWVAKIGSTVVWMVWEGSDLPTGYDGAVYVTGDINQFTSSYMANGCTTNCTAMNLMRDVVEYSVPAETVTVTITSTQTTAVNTAKGTSDNGVDLNVNGDDNTLNIQQAGEDNFITGSDWSSTGTITGTDNTLNVDQGNITTSGSSGRNGIGLDITGNSNTLNLSQGDYSVDVGDHRMHLDIDGSTNTLNLSQRNDGDTNSEHYMSLDLDSSQNVISIQQLNDGDKFLFLDVDNNNNTVDVNQSGDGSHYMDIKLGTGSYAHDVDISQTGDGNHAGRVDLDGYSTDFDLLQQGSTSQSYSLDMTCGTANGCAVSTIQGN